MRSLFAITLLLVAVAAGAQTEPDIIGDETMISGIDRVFIVGTYVGRPSSETGPAIFMVYRHARDGGTYYLCIAYGKRAAMIRQAPLEAIVAIAGHHKRMYFMDEGVVVIVADKLTVTSNSK